MIDLFEEDLPDEDELLDEEDTSGIFDVDYDSIINNLPVEGEENE